MKKINNKVEKSKLWKKKLNEDWGGEEDTMEEQYKNLEYQLVIQDIAEENGNFVKLQKLIKETLETKVLKVSFTTVCFASTLLLRSILRKKIPKFGVWIDTSEQEDKTLKNISKELNNIWQKEAKIIEEEEEREKMNKKKQGEEEEKKKREENKKEEEKKKEEEEKKEEERKRKEREEEKNKAMQEGMVESDGFVWDCNGRQAGTVDELMEDKLEKMKAEKCTAEKSSAENFDENRLKAAAKATKAAKKNEVKKANSK
jgi:hypothetical protein